MIRRVLSGAFTIVMAASLLEAGPIRKQPRPMAEVVADVLAVRGRGRLKRLYEHAIKGFSVELSEEDAAFLADDYRVEFVEEDGIVDVNASQSGATWGLDRIDQRDLPLNQTYTYGLTGTGVHAYISTPASAPPTSSSRAASATATRPFSTATARPTAAATARTPAAPPPSTSRPPRPRRPRRSRRASSASPRRTASRGRDRLAQPALHSICDNGTSSDLTPPQT